MTQRNLLLVSGAIDPQRAAQIEAGERPRADYFEIAREIQADILDYGQMRRTQGVVGRLLDRLSANLALAWAAWQRRRRYRLILSDGEQVGIPLAVLTRFSRRRPKHIMIVHILSVGKKIRFFDLFRIQNQIDRYVVYSTWQKRFIQERLGIPPERVVWSPFQADGEFFKPLPDIAPRRMIAGAGLEFRDYPTLLEAVRGLDVEVVLAAASPWSKRADTTADQNIPPNVTVQRFDLFELRRVYAEAMFVVVPLYEVNFQAGVTTILEAMAMGKAVVVSRTPGQTDVIVQGETGLYVPPADPAAMRETIRHLLDHPEEARRMGANARRALEEKFSLDVYVRGLGKLAREVGGA
ncbi:MAG: glycosyltransferase family 4 protein [Chloroflexota bacterium]